MLQMWTIKSTESTNICYISDRVACTTKLNIKKRNGDLILTILLKYSFS